MSEYHIDYAMVQSVIKTVNPELAYDDQLVRALTYMVDRVRREGKMLATQSIAR